MATTDTSIQPMATLPTGPSTTASMATQLGSAAIGNNTPPISQSQAQSAYKTASDFTNNEQSYLNTTQSNLTKESGIPAIQSQYGNLSQVYQMWLADQNLSQKYASPTLNTPNSPVFNGNLSASNTSYNSNPYLSESPSQLLANVTHIGPNAQGNFQGFSTPGGIITAEGEVPNAVTALLNTLSNAYTGVSGNVQNVLNQAQNEYQQQASNLNAAANYLVNAYQTQQAANQPPGIQTGETGTNIQNSIINDILSQLPKNASQAQVVNFVKSPQVQAFLTKNYGAAYASQAIQWANQGIFNTGGTKTASTPTVTVNTKDQTTKVSYTFPDGTKIIAMPNQNEVQQALDKIPGVSSIPGISNILGQTNNYAAQDIISQGEALGDTSQGIIKTLQNAGYSVTTNQ